MSYEAHEYAGIFPMMTDHDVDQLAGSIQENGLRESIILLDGKILDGRNRYKACEIAGVEPHFEDYDGEDALQFVLDHNLHRRHLTETQRAMVASKMANLKDGSNRFQKVGAPIGAPISKKEAAAALNVGTTTVERAKRVQSKGSEKLKEACERGEVTVNAASQITSLPEEEQDALVEQGAEAIKEKAREISKKPKDPKEVDPSRIKITQKRGLNVAATVIAILEKITPGDEEREEALNQIIKHCQERLAQKK